MKNKICFILCLISLFHLNAQEYIIRNVESERICNILLMELSLNKDTSIVYYKDESFSSFPQNGHKIKKDQDFSVSDTKVNLMFKYLNPLKYSISINSSARDDEELKNGMKTFMAGISGLSSLTSKSEAAITTLEALKKADVSIPKGSTTEERQSLEAFNSEFVINEKISESQKLVSIEAIQLFVFLNQNEILANNSLSTKEVEKLVKYMVACENTFLSKTFENELKKQMTKLINASNIKDLDSVVSEINISELERQAAMVDTINRFSNFDFEGFLNKSTEIKKKVISKDLALYHRIIAESYHKLLLDKYNSVIQNRKVLVQNLKKVISRAKSFSEQNFWRGEYFALIQSFDVNRTNFYDISVTIKAYKYNFDDNSFAPSENTVLTQKFSLKRIRQAILSFSGLGMYTNVTYSQFLTDTENGKSVIKETKTNRNYYNIGIAMNVLPNIRNTMFLPGIQFAASVANGYPCFLSGICFVWPDYNFNVSGGVMFGWNQILTGGFKVGDEASDAQIKENTSWQFNTNGNFYLGISYNIPWK